MQLQYGKKLITEKELLLKIAVRDRHAFTTLYQRNHKKVYTYSLKLLKSDSQAEEIMQEVFLKLWNIEKSANEIINLDAWLFTLTYNRCMSVLRRRALEARTEREQIKGFMDWDNSTEEEIILNDTRRILQQGILKLPPQQKLVYQLCREEGISYEEAALKLNISHGTVQTHMKLALKFLRNYLKNHTDIAIVFILFRLF